MAQMSEAARKRRNELCVDLTEDALTKHNEGDEQQNAFKVVVFDALKKAYEAGMQNPDANKELMDEMESFLEDLISGIVSLKYSIKEAEMLLDKIREARK